ncbi:MAG TPA: DNA-processing protein DprA [Candidatus Nitrosotenuis sp.]|nr:DNA-processing protein DprA [Candidatus Nitrosotenuis sp.]
MSRRERACWLALAGVDGLPPARVFALVGRCGSARAAWEAAGPEGLSRRAWAGLLAARRTGPAPEDLLEEAERVARVVTPADPDYPPVLLHLSDPPPALHLRGSLSLETDRPIVAVVGSRQASSYGLALAHRLGCELGGAGVVVASGLARGVDGAAHRGCLAGGGSTLAVLGCGIEVCYPPEHRRLRAHIEACGLVVSEYGGKAPPEPWRFPARNRILAALARGVVVVEASRRSGALITAGMALQIGREVMAVPGPVGSPQSEGTLQLVKDGAALVRDGQDVLAELGLGPARGGAAPLLQGAALQVWQAVGPAGSCLDEVIERSGLPVGEVHSWVLRLELAGRLRRLPDGTLTRL